MLSFSVSLSRVRARARSRALSLSLSFSLSLSLSRFLSLAFSCGLSPPTQCHYDRCRLTAVLTCTPIPYSITLRW